MPLVSLPPPDLARVRPGAAARSGWLKSTPSSMTATTAPGRPVVMPSASRPSMSTSAVPPVSGCLRSSWPVLFSPHARSQPARRSGRRRGSGDGRRDALRRCGSAPQLRDGRRRGAGRRVDDRRSGLAERRGRGARPSRARRLARARRSCPAERDDQLIRVVAVGRARPVAGRIVGVPGRRRGLGGSAADGEDDGRRDGERAMMRSGPATCDLDGGSGERGRSLGEHILPGNPCMRDNLDVTGAPTVRVMEARPADQHHPAIRRPDRSLRPGPGRGRPDRHRPPRRPRPDPRRVPRRASGGRPRRPSSSAPCASA